MTIEEIDRLVEALRQDPEGRRALLRALLSDDFVSLPERVVELDARLAALAVQVAEIDARLTSRLEDITARVDALTARIDALTVQVQALVGVVSHQGDQLGDLRGWRIEDRYRTHGDALLSSLARRLRLMDRAELMEVMEDAEDAGVLSHQEATDVRLADAVFRGRGQDGEGVYLVVEASAGIGPSDVARARRRADILARTGLRALAVVGGERIGPDSATLARSAGVEVVVDGRRPQAS